MASKPRLASKARSQKGIGRALPYVDQIQGAFGDAHDLSQVRAHVGGDTEVRQWAASSLGELGDANARAALEEAQASDADEGVRLMARMALDRLR